MSVKTETTKHWNYHPPLNFSRLKVTIMEGSTIAPSVKHHSVELEDCGSVNVFIQVIALVDVKVFRILRFSHPLKVPLTLMSYKNLNLGWHWEAERGRSLSHSSWCWLILQGLVKYHVGSSSKVLREMNDNTTKWLRVWWSWWIFAILGPNSVYRSVRISRRLKNNLIPHWCCHTLTDTFRTGLTFQATRAWRIFNAGVIFQTDFNNCDKLRLICSCDCVIRFVWFK